MLAPFVLVALVGGLVKIVLTALWPGLAGTWAMLAVWPVAGMRHVVGWLATFPAADVPVPPPPVWLIVLYYALLLPALLPPARAPRVSTRLLLFIGRVATCMLLLLFPLQRGLEQHVAPSGETRVTLLAVGAGQCAVVQPSSGRTVLVDAGSSSLSDLVGKCLGPFLRHSRCTQIDSIFLSHGDYDHVSGVEEIVAGYGVRDVLTGCAFIPHARENAFDVELLAALDRLERPPHILTPGDQAPLGTDTTIQVLWPPRDVPPNLPANEGCMVIKLTHAGRSILFPGDIQDVAMRGLLKEPQKLKSDVLVAAHHGSSESLTGAFIGAVDPSIILSSNDRTLTNKQRDFETVMAGRRLYRTNRSGSITVIIDRDGNLRVEPFLTDRGN